ncbi:MAG: hypothetical protein AABX83_02945 [Nanoarchaeota archaeon]
MAPQKDKVEILDLDSIQVNSIGEHSNRTKIAETILAIKKDRRITIYHYVVHILAFLIIIPYIFMTFIGNKISDSYSTIVSVVIGFYFARSLFGELY